MRISDWSSDVCSSDLTTCGVVNELRSTRQDKMNGPTLFLSSTVFDITDLRSALQDYLELRGCRVLASEFTDFTHPLDMPSYEASRASTCHADLLGLLIGWSWGCRVGAVNR